MNPFTNVPGGLSIWPRTGSYASSRAAGFAKYVKIIDAPARVIDVRLSIMVRS